ncbi:MAG: hypothetical protein BWY45_02575 [Euryarchaeota archaeon ADurb.Bin294]|nr:MAG: hypothetical protein BWY45_02575 [Euryarchaeota archaeon ADurb.Bin294]
MILVEKWSIRKIIRNIQEQFYKKKETPGFQGNQMLNLI